MNLGYTNIFYLLLRTTLIFVVLLILTRILGKKQLSQLTFFNYITGITIGSIAANVVSESNQPFIDEFIGLIWWCVLTYLAGYIGLKSGKLRNIIDGQPTIVIKKGKIIRNALKSSRLNIDDLSMMLRKQNIFSIKEVEYAILEPNGDLSTLKKPENQHISKSDMNITSPIPKYLPSEIIADDKIIRHNLNWLNDQIKTQNISSVKDILYAEIQSNGTLYIQKN